jgi:alpha-tubulin suppressor-like RCC1 family protein
MLKWPWNVSRHSARGISARWAVPLAALSLSACLEATPTSSFFESNSSPRAVLGGLPPPLNNWVTFTVSVGGFQATEYRYWFGQSSFHTCLDAPYSAELPIGASVAITTGADTNFRLCVLANNDDEEWQTPDQATEYNWFRDTAPPTVTVNQAAGQADPTNLSTGRYTVQFSEAMNFSGLSATNFLHGPGGTNSRIDTIMILDQQTVEVTVEALVTGTAMSWSLSMLAGQVWDLAGNPNMTSTSTDPDIIHDSQPPPLNVVSPTEGSFINNVNQVITGFCEIGTPIFLSGPFMGSPSTTSCTGGAFSFAMTLAGADGAKAISLLQTDMAGNASPRTLNLNLDRVAPTVVEVNSTFADGGYGTGTTVEVYVRFNEDVVVNTGLPALQLELGVTDPLATLIGSPAGGVATFSFFVNAPYTSTDLDYVAMTSLTSGTFRDAAGNLAILTLPPPGSGTSLSGTRNIRIVSQPAVLSIVPGSVAFGSIATGVHGDQVATVSNLGGYQATGINPTGLAAPFSVTGGTCGSILAPASSCTLNLRFSPTAVTSSSDTLVLEFNDGLSSQSQNLGLSGIGVINNPPQITGVPCVGTAYAGGTYNCMASATGLNDPGEAGQWELDNGCSWMSVNPLTGVITGSPSVTDVGDCVVEIRAKDFVNGDSVWKSQVRVLGRPNFGDFAGGPSHSCMIVGGETRCWGENLNGSLGRSGMVVLFPDFRPQPIRGTPSTSAFAGLQQISAGLNFTCGRTNAGSAVCWGAGLNGQMGNGASVSQTKPVPVTGLSTGVVQVSAGQMHACALSTSGQVRCWGRNVLGQLGNGGNVNQNTPQLVVDSASNPISEIISIAAGLNHTCALRADKKVFCWGDNALGILGRGQTVAMLSSDNRAGEVLNFGHPSVDRPMSLYARGPNTCVILEDRGARCWGDNSEGQLGQGDTLTRGDTPATMNIPVIDLASGVRNLAMGLGHVCADLTSGSTKCWGKNSFGQLGQGDTLRRGDNSGEMGANLLPINFHPSMSTTISTFAGHEFNCALRFAPGPIFRTDCWGRSDSLQLGLATGSSVGDGPGEMGSNLQAVVYDPVRYMFTSSSALTGSAVGGHSGADSQCQGLATGADLFNAANYQAVMATSFLSADRGLSLTGQLIRRDGALISNTWGGLFSGGILSAIDRDQSGTVIGSNFQVWTGASTTGAFIPGSSCADWTSNASSGQVGDLTSTSVFMSSSISSCATARRIYCVDGTSY